MDSILYQDNHLLIVNKRSGQISQGDQTQDVAISDEYKPYIKEKYKKAGNVFLHPAHRLDRPVSGCMILARTSKGLSRLTTAFREGKVEKHYLALSKNRSREVREVLIHHVSKDRIKNKVRVVNKRRGKYAELSYERLLLGVLRDKKVGPLMKEPPPEHLERGRSLSVYHIQPKTGRSHQIRVQLSHIGVPILGDVKYGGQEWKYPKGIALHCYAMRFEHPTKKEIMMVKVGPPKYWHQYFDPELLSALEI